MQVAIRHYAKLCGYLQFSVKICNHAFGVLIVSNTVSKEYLSQRQGRSQWSSRSGHGQIGFGLYQIIDRFKSIIPASSIKLYYPLPFRSVASIIFHTQLHDS